MKNQLRRVWQELRQGKNVEVYLTIAVAFVILCLHLFHVTSINAVLSAILATLVLLAIANLHSRRGVEDLGASVLRLEIGTLADKFFQQWNEAEFSDFINRAKRVSMLAVANNRFLSENQIQFTELIRRGGEIRALLIDPTGAVLNMSTTRSVGASTQPNYVKMHVEMSKEKLREFQIGATRSNQVRLKYIDLLPSIIITWLEFDHDPGMMLLTLTAFRQPTASRPSFTLSEEKDSKWYKYFKDYYENIWEWEGTKDIALS